MPTVLRSLLLWLCGALALGSGVDGAAARTPLPVAQVTQVADSSFQHDRHEDFECLDCHAMGSGHGALRVRDVTDCRRCHHVPEQVNRVCADCHEPTELGPLVYQRERSMRLSVVEGVVTRRIDFSHQVHQERECVECHVGGPSLAAPDLDCQACHEEHHVETSSGCVACHRPPEADAHTLEVHLTCSGAGCHVDPPFEASPLTRVACLWCHGDKETHEPQEDTCIECHFLGGPASPASRGGVPLTTQTRMPAATLGDGARALPIGTGVPYDRATSLRGH
jgi:hypothetical protein